MKEENKKTKYIEYGNYCFVAGEYTLKQYKRCVVWYEGFIEYFNNIDVNNIDYDELRKTFNSCDQLFLSYMLSYMYDCQEQMLYVKLIDAIIEALNKKVEGIPLGDIMIRKSIEEGILLSIPELAYDIKKEYSELGFYETPRFIHRLVDTPCGAAHPDSLSIDMYVYDRNELPKDFSKGEIRDYNISYLYTIRHEMMHVIQFENESNAKSNKFAVLYELFAEFYNQKLYHEFHDELPFEYFADLYAYERIIKDIGFDYRTSFSEEIILNVKTWLRERNHNYPTNPLDAMCQKLELLANMGQISDDRKNILMDKIKEIQNSLDIIPLLEATDRHTDDLLNH